MSWSWWLSFSIHLDPVDGIKSQECMTDFKEFQCIGYSLVLVEAAEDVELEDFLFGFAFL
jgi:hypothetical protein